MSLSGRPLLFPATGNGHTGRRRDKSRMRPDSASLSLDARWEEKSNELFLETERGPLHVEAGFPVVAPFRESAEEDVLFGDRDGEHRELGGREAELLERTRSQLFRGLLGGPEKRRALGRDHVEVLPAVGDEPFDGYAVHSHDHVTDRAFDAGRNLLEDLREHHQAPLELRMASSQSSSARTVRSSAA